MDKTVLLESLMEKVWDIAIQARDGADPQEVEFLLEDFEQQLAEAIGLRPASPDRP